MNFPFKLLSFDVRGGLGMVRKHWLLKLLSSQLGFSFLALIESKREVVERYLISN